MSCLSPPPPPTPAPRPQVMTNGRERTQAEWQRLYASAGLVLEQVLPAGKLPVMVVALAPEPEPEPQS